ncbi:MAG: hypothetical protein M1356_04510, partial [Gammaproteobacteria bacterium]|nr:hypothetical protein [Gammaproteobacteria bacterium]
NMTSTGGNIWTFHTAGTYYLNLTVTDKSGEINSTTTPITITVTKPLEITLNANRTLISADQWVKFTNTTSGGTGSNVYAYSFSCTGTVQNATNGNVWQFTTASETPCTVTLKVTDASGEVNTSTSDIQVNTTLEITEFKNITGKISADQSVTFTNTTTGGTGSNIWTYFVNGQKVTPNANGSISFHTAGLYTVSLGVVDQSGEVANAIDAQQINVTPPLEITSFTCTQETGSGCDISADQSVTFTNTTSGGTGSNVYTYSGTAAGNMTSTGGNIWTFHTAGTYYLNLTVTDKSGEINSTTTPITITVPVH